MVSVERDNLFERVLTVDAWPRLRWKAAVMGLRSNTRCGEALEHAGPVGGPSRLIGVWCPCSASGAFSLSGGGYLSTFGGVARILAKFKGNYQR